MSDASNCAYLIGCYVECIRGRWRVSYPDGSPFSYERHRRKQDADQELADAIRREVLE